MPAEQRIIGGGLLLVGVAIALILLYLFNWAGMSAPEAVSELEKTIYPAYAKAEEQGDYIAMKQQASRATEVMEKGGAAAVAKALLANATGGTREAKKLYDLVKDGVFAKNAEGLYGFAGSWFRESTHRALLELGACVDDRMKVLRLLRATAEEARAALEDARTGSGKEIPLPPAPVLEPEEVPIVKPNPVFENDLELFRVFGLRGEALLEALASPNPGGKATSSRLRWNRDIVTGGLAKQIDGIPDQVEEMKKLAVRIELAAKTASEDASARETLRAVLGRGADAVAARLPDAAKAMFDTGRDRFAEGDALARVLRREVAILTPHLASIRALAAAFGREFAK